LESRPIPRVSPYKKLDGGAKEESGGALWERSAGESTVTRIRVVHPGNNSDLQ